MLKNLVTILGPTACGKTKLAAQLCFHFNGEIISADSRQVYKGMNIGTGKDYDDYLVNGKKIPYHLIDVIEPVDEYNVFQFQQDVQNSIIDMTARGKLPFLVGGTGMYLSSILQNYKMNKAEFDNQLVKEYDSLSTDELKDILLKIKPELHNTTDLIERERIVSAIIVHQHHFDLSSIKIEAEHLIIGISPQRDAVKQRIKSRLSKRFDQGMIEEVTQLIGNGVTHERLQRFGLEYKFISKYLLKELNYNDMFQKLNSAINNFAKRQMTWFRKMEREGLNINWIDEPSFGKAKEIIDRNLFAN